MRHKLFMSWAALRWVLLMFLIAPGMEAPLVAHLNQPVKPIKTWAGNSSWYGPGFNGPKPANGERVDCEALVALDYDALSAALKFAKQVADLVGMFKIGNQLFTAAGPAAVKEVAALGPGVFLDLKFHDIPTTVAGAVLSSAALSGVQLVNVH